MPTFNGYYYRRRQNQGIGNAEKGNDQEQQGPQKEHYGRNPYKQPKYPGHFGQNVSAGAATLGRPQAKIAIGAVNSQYEREADSVAEQVVKGSQGAPAKGPGANTVQRKEMPISTVQRMGGEEETSAKVQRQEEEAAEATVQRQEEEEAAGPMVQRQEEEEAAGPMVQRQEEEEAAGPMVQRQEEEGAEATVQRQEEEEAAGPMVQRAEEEAAEATVQQKANKPMRPKTFQKSKAPRSFERGVKKTRGKGQPLPPTLRRYMEQSIGADFRKVRIHKDAEAVKLNRAISAQAFAIGNDIYFNAGKFNPQTESGRFLLAHELTHVVQQNGREGRK